MDFAAGGGWGWELMASYNKVILVGRITRDPESRSFANGGKVTKFGFAATADRKKNQATGQWEDVPVFIDCEVYNRGDYGKLADLIADKCRKGSQLLIEGKLHIDQWDDKATGAKRSKHKIVVDVVQLLDGRGERTASGQQSQSSDEHVSTPADSGGGQGSDSESIPF